MGFLGTLVKYGADALTGLLGLAVDVVGGIIIAVVALLPTWSLSDFMGGLDGFAGRSGVFDEVMGWVNWFVPIQPMFYLLLAWFGLVLAYKAYLLIKGILTNIQ